MNEGTGVRAAWVVALGAAVLTRVANAVLQPGPAGYDAWGHVTYVLFLDVYHGLPFADQGWSYFHPPLHYALGFLLAQAGSAETLIRGLSFLGSAASLGTALLAAVLVRRTFSARPWLPVLAFTAVAFLPVHIYTSPMPGNEQTATFLGCAAVVVFLANARRPRASAALDAASGVLAGLALLTKFSGLLALIAIVATLGLSILRGACPVRRGFARMSAVLACVAIVAGPWYARSVVTYGTPFPLSRDTPLVASLERHQAPGQRSWKDFVYVPATLFSVPDWRGAHVLHSVWGTVYLRAWVEDRPGLGWRRTLAAVGVIPTGLALIGLLGALARARRDPGASEDVAMAALALTSLVAFALFALRVPIYSALKASYLLNATLAYGYFVCRALALPSRRGTQMARRIGWAGVLLAASVSALAFTHGLALPRLRTNFFAGEAHAHFGDFDPGRAAYGEALAGFAAREAGSSRSGGSPGGATEVAIRESLAALEVRAGRPRVALDLYEQAVGLPRPDSPHLSPLDSPYRLNDVAVAAALAGQKAQALRLLDEALVGGIVVEPLQNRAALRALAGDRVGAEEDLEQVLRAAPRLAAAHANLAWLRRKSGNATEAAKLRERAEQLSRSAPRGFPYGVGDGFRLNERRFLLVLEGDGLALYRPARARAGRR